MKIGDKVRKRLTGLFKEGERSAVPTVAGTVKWIHPLGRFYMAEFNFRGAVIRECFPMEGE